MFIRKDTLAAAAAGPAPGAGSPPAAPHDPPGPRVLIVEDDGLLAAATAMTLTDADCAVVGTAGTAEDALALARARRPDLVLMDVDLGGPRTGIDAAIDIWTGLGIRSLFLTGRADAATRRRAEPAHPLGWLTKPCDQAALAAAIRAACGR